MDTKENEGSGVPAPDHAEMRITLAFDAVPGRDREVFARCKYSDVAERMATAVAKEVGMVVLVIHADPTQPVRRFEMAKVQTWDVVKTHVPHEILAKAQPNP